MKYQVDRAAYMAIWAEAAYEIHVAIASSIATGISSRCEKASKENCLKCKHFTKCIYETIDMTTPKDDMIVVDTDMHDMSKR